MCYDDKINALVGALRPLVRFKDSLHAEQYATYWKPVLIKGKTAGQVLAEEKWKKQISQEVDELAGSLCQLALEHPEECVLGRAVSAITAADEGRQKVCLSAMRDAIRLLARQRVERREKRIEQELASEHSSVLV